MANLTQRDRNFPVVRANDEARDYSRNLDKNSVRILGFNYASLLGALGTTISSSTWATNDSSTVSLASAAETTITSYVTATAASAGNALLTNTVTCADGQVLVRTLVVRVDDPDIDRLKDYSSDRD